MGTPQIQCGGALSSEFLWNGPRLGREKSHLGRALWVAADRICGTRRRISADSFWYGGNWFHNGLRLASARGSRNRRRDSLRRVASRLRRTQAAIISDEQGGGFMKRAWMLGLAMFLGIAAKPA